MSTDESFKDRIPDIFPLYDESSDFRGLIDAFDSEFDTLISDIDYVKKSVQITNATGNDLDEAGKDFGVLGKRRGRSDSAYRSYLLSIVSSFKGRGTNPGVRTAIAAGIGIAKDDISLIEDFQNQKYQVEILNWSSHGSSTINTMADLADPVAIERIDPTIYYMDTGVLVGVGDDTAATISGGYGLSASELDNLSSGGWNLSDET